MVEFKSNFVFMCYNIICFNQIHHKCKKLNYICYFIPAYAGMNSKEGITRRKYTVEEKDSIISDTLQYIIGNIIWVINLQNNVKPYKI